MVGILCSTLSGLLLDTLLHKGPTHINIIGDPLSLASYKFEKVDHIPGLREPWLIHLSSAAQTLGCHSSLTPSLHLMTGVRAARSH